MNWSDKTLTIFESVFKFYMTRKWTRRWVFFKTDWTKDKVDVRTSLYLDMESEILLKDFVNEKFGKYTSDNDKVTHIYKWVLKNIKYKSDESKWNKLEYWQDAITTYTDKSGDCEDGSILLYHLLRLSGVAEWRFKIVAGNVQYSNGAKAGHCYVIYCGNDLKWYTLDWCWYPAQVLRALFKTPHKDLNFYADIWFAFNRQHSWTNVETNINELD